MPGQMVHLEIPAGDTAKAREFWSSLFGWQWQTFEGPTEYHMTRFSETTGGPSTGRIPPRSAELASTSTSTTSMQGTRV